MFNKIRFITKEGKTHVFLDDKEVQGCIRASFDYDMDHLPVVELTLKTIDVEVEADRAEIIKISEEPIAKLNLTVGTTNILRDGVWYNKKHERLVDPVRTIGKLLQEYKAGRIVKYKGLGPHRLCEITNALKERGLI